MPDWLIQGDKIPPITLDTIDTIDGKTISLPDDIEGRYLALLFYRGNW